MDVICTLTNGAEVLIERAVIGRGADGMIEGEHRGSAVRFPKSEVTRTALAERGRAVKPRGEHPAQARRRRRGGRVNGERAFTR
jgi:hypothetical protein